MTFIIIIIYIVFISLGLPDSLFGVSWPVVHNEFQIAESFGSVYSIIVGLATGGVSFISGMLIRKLGVGKVTLFSTLLTVVALIGISFSSNIVVMMIFAIILGYGAGAIDTGVNNFASLHFKAHHMNFLHCFWGVGVTLSPLIMSAFLGDGSSNWRGGYRAVAIIQLIISVIILFSLKKWQNVENSINSQIEKDLPEEASAEKKSFLDIVKIKGVIPAIFSLGLYCSMEFLLGTWGASYAVNVFALPPEEAAKWVSLYYGGIMAGRFVAGFASMKLNDKIMIRSGIIIAFLGVVFLSLPLGIASLFGFILIGFGFGPIFPSVLHSIPERFGKTYSADITGFHMGGAYAIGFSSQLIYGFAATGISFKITPFVLVAFTAGLFLLNEVVNKKTALK